MVRFFKIPSAGKRQINFRVCTGITEIPAVLTIQTGDVNDKSHFKAMQNVFLKNLLDGSPLFLTVAETRKRTKMVFCL